MSNILEKIVEKRKSTVEQLKKTVPLKALQKMPFFEQECPSLKKSIMDGPWGIIAEFKRASPSKGIINAEAELFDVISAYETYGASGVSILTEPEFFQGTNDDILNVAGTITIPILRKDFIIDEYQVIESKAIGANCILLIAAVLTRRETEEYAKLAREIGLEVLLEVHNEMELDWITDQTDLVGVNNRNLKTFEVDINTSLSLINNIPGDKLSISESGIADVNTIITLKKAGFRGFLIGENFMKQADPAIAFADFVRELKAKVT